MFKIMIIGDLNAIHNVFGVYNSDTGKIEIYSWLDIYQDIKFDSVKYLNLGMNKEGKIGYLDRYIRIPKTRDEYKGKNFVYVLSRKKGTDLVKFITFPDCKNIVSSVDDLVKYCNYNKAVKLNFDIKSYPKNEVIALHRNGIPKID